MGIFQYVPDNGLSAAVLDKIARSVEHLFHLRFFITCTCGIFPVRGALGDYQEAWYQKET